MKIITHNGAFHADDLFAAATLSILYGDDLEIIRTRDENIIATGDIVFDVGRVYDPAKKRFDHHQLGGAGERTNGIPYASFGLIWKEFGEQIIGTKEKAEEVDRKIVQPIDAQDNGMSISTPLFDNVSPYTFDDVASAFGNTWKEKGRSENESFTDVMKNIAKKILTRQIKRISDRLDAASLVESAYLNASDKRLIVLDEEYPWREVLIKYPEPIYVIAPRPADNGWGVGTVRVNLSSFQNRKDLPEAWAGQEPADLARITGVNDAVFCHRARFLAVARSKEGAIALAKLALES